ncbi:MAG: transposase [Dehalococcoidia bacterium]
MNYFDERTTAGFAEGCHTMIKVLKRVSYGVRNLHLYSRKTLLICASSRSCFHTI